MAKHWFRFGDRDRQLLGHLAATPLELRDVAARFFPGRYTANRAARRLYQLERMGYVDRDRTLWPQATFVITDRGRWLLDRLLRSKNPRQT